MGSLVEQSTPNSDFMRILFQFPEGLKQKACAFAKKLEAEGNKIYLSASPCYGGCDLALEEAKAIRADKLIHFGHAKFIDVKNPPCKIEYEEYPITADLTILKKSLPLLKTYKKIGLVTTVQHVHQLNAIAKILRKAGKKVFIGKSKSPRIKYAGQILGCDISSAKMIEKKVDCIIVFAGGRFHALGLEIKKPILQIDPFARTARFLTEEIAREKRKRKGALLAAAYAKTFGILVSTKIGQFNLRAAEEIKRKLEAKGKTAFILISNEIDPLALADFNIFDAYINTACPRIAEDYERFDKPVINADELLKII